MTAAPIRKTITVGLTPQAAFDLFTNGMETWWPLDTHSRANADKDETTEHVVFERRPEGSIYEVLSTGAHSQWGRVTVCEPPDRSPTEVEVTFTPVDGGTRVDLEHRKWELLPDLDPADHESYDVGWDYVFVERFGDAAGPPA
jgi:hypothetical protein